MNDIESRRHEFERVADGPFWGFVMDRLKKFRAAKCRDLEMAEVDTFKVIQGEIKSLDFALGSAQAYDHMLKDRADKIKETEEKSE